MRRGVPYRGCIAADGDGSSLRDANPFVVLLTLLAVAAMLLFAGCAGAPPARPASPELQDAAHRDLLDTIRGPDRVRVVPWKHNR